MNDKYMYSLIAVFVLALLAYVGVAAAGLDVLEQEPPDLDNPLMNMDNVMLTPHAASATTRMRLFLRAPRRRRAPSRCRAPGAI